MAATGAKAQRAGPSERAEDAFRVVGIGSDQHVHILGGTWMPLKGDRMSTHQYEIGPRVC